ncbi:Holliday junction branch migration protein RuvA [Anaerosacchariphilus polymeriproducens]|uniref:Holliday junction branch migration complex subunit RuvA n=1 Tax=Anaerosacchariphilus polymeriproducens TaxID=1812858 RepID=A0A371AU66_9FIRM|nr:Holliday junction branch migration protein RuvA [Anaerosacchariphilus polymeriproducens]RDU23107.1 Holliday junction branch migration protein RuvA [Anaerosacchariphilus polymeriproducens]
MISYIKGEIIDIQDDLLIMETNQIGYNIKISTQTASMLPAIGEDTKIYTYLHVREDAVQLFGFSTKDDLNIFKLLIGVNGIGPKGALGILSALSADDLRFAVLGDDVKTISKAPGIGTKTAQRLIIELKDKLNLEDAFEQKLENKELQNTELVNGQDAKSEAVQALIALGYTSAEAIKAVKQVKNIKDMDAEAILKESLKQISFM